MNIAVDLFEVLAVMLGEKVFRNHLGNKCT
jgi:hypothetical protein